ncbi:MAG: bifunctional DNA-formamidopyrimidine glycosylase/DNA-(apurinic or apyrimidinic site) lyase [Anaerolineae bacterium]|nr:bifunctional DNA-formamidopyrimidine glycosylase/DNA-(apurinic or apyrimidinic site) lyase [Anaerolineae bacterium]
MPELPEVETIARSLRVGNGDSPSLIGAQILDAKLLWHKTLATPSESEFRHRIQGQTIESIERRAKYLQINLSEDVLLIHLRMSGDLVAGEGTEPLGKYPRLVFTLSKGLQLCFTDARKFGRVWLVEDPLTVLDKLGPEPLDPEFTPAVFAARLQARKRQIKPLLLDQGFLAGMGNIYTDEALHLAKIHPATRADQLEPKQGAALLATIRTVLNEGIRRNGASIDWVYRGGEFQNQFQVYQRTGEPCLQCGTPIARMVIGQRGTHYCPRCQVPVGV